MNTAEELVKLYEAAQKKLVEIIQDKTIRGSPAAYERRILKQVSTVLKQLKKASPELVRQLVLEGYQTGLESAVEDILHAKITTPPAYSLFSRVNTEQINLLIQNAVDSLTKAVHVVGRRIEDEIRSAGLRAAALKNATGGTIKAMQKDLEKRLLGLDLRRQDGRMGVQYRNGRVMPIDKYAEMVSRTTPAEAQNKAKIIQGTEWGYDLVRCTTHTPTCEVCAKYQGRVYALTREAANGKYKGPKGEPLHFPLLYETALVHGYETIHPNCRHRFTVLVARAYSPSELAGMSRKSMRPFEDTRSDAERKAYAQEQALKRARNADMREWRKYRAALSDQAPATFAGFRSMKRANSERYQDLKKDYRYLIDGRQSGILKNKKLKPIRITDEAINRVPFISFQTLDSSRSKTLQELHCSLLQYVRSESPETEAIAYYDLDLNLITQYMGGKNQVRATRYDSPHIIMHNHPDGLTFTHDDLVLFLRNPNISILSAVGNNGALYTLEKLETFNVSDYLHFMTGVISKHPDMMSSPEEYLKAMEELLKGADNYGFSYVARTPRGT